MNLKQHKVNRVKISSDGKTIISHSDDEIKAWNLQTAELEATLDKERMSYLVVSSDGKLLVGITGDLDNQNTQIKVLKRP
ncbi:MULTISPECIES: WD40 repeat domain-containing protein [unclassified Coleofasciculus]|uniref:WD40 repeat domain-containing protein n=1 Tax=unclassified Coleofasciculus TaxID=2692782 RepID=UPI001880746C|nr:MULTISPECIES: hypothetical protein [unclassified Coleofasciculus]MBE9127958.1 hypothetical protein [Coleofasciculus sp. LEGE 07081]MBE9149863.1 hypothetical protein [Coleofasciculus sp. LEGE 07092]